MYDELNTSEPLVILLGNIGHEGILSSLSAAGRQYKRKLLESTPLNWAIIARYFDDFSVKAVVAKLSPSVYEHLVDEGYDGVAGTLLTRISSVPHIVFVFESLFDPNFDPSVDSNTDFSDGFHVPTVQVRETVNRLLRKFNINVMPYRRNAEVTVMAGAFVSETEEGLLFRVYVPVGRMWADETSRLLQLFRDYLGKVAQTSVRLDSIRTDRGTIYEFRGDRPSGEPSLANQFREFSHFLDISVSNPKEAEALLQGKNISPAEIVEALTRYGKEARRLQIDLKQEWERKLLGIRHRLESELAEMLPTDIDWGAIETFIIGTVPALANIGSSLLVAQVPLASNTALVSNSTSVTINLKPQIIQAVSGIVAQEIRGDVKLSEQGRLVGPGLSL